MQRHVQVGAVALREVDRGGGGGGGGGQWKFERMPVRTEQSKLAAYKHIAAQITPGSGNSIIPER
jgi:hypothetical protein